MKYSLSMKQFKIFVFLFLLFDLGCEKNNLNDQPLTGTEIHDNLPGIYQGTVVNYYTSTISDLIFNNVNVSLKNSGYVGYLYAYPGLFFHTDSDFVKIDTSLSNYWKVIPNILFKGPRNQMEFIDSNAYSIIKVSYDFNQKLLVIDYKNYLNKQQSHFYGNKISN